MREPTWERQHARNGSGTKASRTVVPVLQRQRHPTPWRGKTLGHLTNPTPRPASMLSSGHCQRIDVRRRSWPDPCRRWSGLRRAGYGHRTPMLPASSALAAPAKTLSGLPRSVAKPKSGPAAGHNRRVSVSMTSGRHGTGGRGMAGMQLAHVNPLRESRR